MLAQRIDGQQRGENISGAELDGVVDSHPDVLDSAAIPVPSALGEDDILMAVMPRPGAALVAEDIAARGRDRLAPFKVPRYVVFTTALPLTPTHRVARYRMRGDASLPAGAVDLERRWASPPAGAARPRG